ncbi:hypothetical protein [Rossellomorea aquimaris]|nr:hypothetical protein [Rossellomorea aquimaris]
MKDRHAKRLIYYAYVLNKMGILDYSQMQQLEKHYSKKRSIT